MKNISELQKIASQVRRDIVRMVTGASSGHPGGALGCADIMTALYFNVLHLDPKKFTIEGHGEDLFFLSNGHISPVWYSVMARRGFFPVADLCNFRKLGSPLQGHPTPAKNLPGVRIASGSLGQGLSNAIGYALAKHLNGDKHLVYVLMGDGETEEGQIWEAAQYAGAKKVDNIIAIVDWNNQQIDGTVEAVMALGDFPKRWEALGWEVLSMKGNDMADILAVFERAKAATGKGKPVVILAHTDMGHGVDFMCGTNAWHGKAPSKEQMETALSQLNETLGDY